jgi:hypothetical protein
MAETRESGIVSVKPSASAPAVEVLRGCHDILGAAAVIVVNLEYVSQGAEGDNRAALEDARTSVEKIVELTNAIRRAHEAAPPSRKRSARSGSTGT